MDESVKGFIEIHLEMNLSTDMPTRKKTAKNIWEEMSNSKCSWVKWEKTKMTSGSIQSWDQTCTWDLYFICLELFFLSVISLRKIPCRWSIDSEVSIPCHFRKKKKPHLFFLYPEVKITWISNKYKEVNQISF